MAHRFTFYQQQRHLLAHSNVPGILPKVFVHYDIQFSQEHCEAVYIIVVIQSQKKLSLRVLLRVTEITIVKSGFELKFSDYKT